MFIGHFGVGFAGKTIDKQPSLGTMFLAAQFLDILWPVFLLLGIEKVKIIPDGSAFENLNFTYYPFSHSFLGALVWSLLFGLVYYAFKKNISGSVLLGSLVFSHWILDLFTHVPDLPLTPWSNIKLGLGLWNVPVATIVIESMIYFGGAYLYLKFRKDENKKGLIGSISLMILLFIIYIASTFGSAPPSVDAIGFAGLGLWVFVAWAYWIDRKPKTSSKSGT